MYVCMCVCVYVCMVCVGMHVCMHHSVQGGVMCNTEDANGHAEELHPQPSLIKGIGAVQRVQDVG